MRPIHVILLAALLAFGASLGAPFHLDDFSILSDHTLTSPSGWWEIWKPLQSRPLTQFTFWLNYQIGGSNPIGYHAFNLFLHLLAIWLLYGALRRLIPENAALIACTIFALHPIQTEAVVYVFARGTLLATVFCLLTLRAWLDKRYWPAVGWFALALLSKEECVTFPLFLLMLQRALLPGAAMLALSCAAGVRVLLASASTKGSGAGLQAGITPLDYFCTQGFVILRYLRLLVLPYGFSADPDISVVTDWRAWLVWTALAITVFFLWRKFPNGWWFALALVMIVPSSSIFPAADLAADRRMYLPMLAFTALGGLLLYRSTRAGMCVFIALFILSATRTYVWASEQRIWTEAVERAPNKLRPRIHLARSVDARTALGILEDAKNLAPEDPGPSSERGMRLLELNRADLALAEFGRALALRPNDPQSITNRGVALLLLNQREAAIEDFRRAIQSNPCLSDARNNLRRLGVQTSVICRD